MPNNIQRNRTPRYRGVPPPIISPSGIPLANDDIYGFPQASSSEFPLYQLPQVSDGRPFVGQWSGAGQISMNPALGRQRYKIANMPIFRDNRTILLDDGSEATFEVINKLNAILLRVKDVTTDESDYGLLHATADDDLLKEATKECKELLYTRLNSSEIEPLYGLNTFSLPFFKEHYVTHLKKPHENFKWAVYYCELCDYHIKNVNLGREHLLQENHFEAEQRIRERDELFQSVKPLLESHYTAMNAEMERMLSLRTREFSEQYELISGRVLQFLKDIVLEDLERDDYSFHLYGSALVLTYDQESDINICAQTSTTDMFKIEEFAEQLKSRIIELFEQRNQPSIIKWENRLLSLSFEFEKHKIDVRFDTETNCGLAKFMRVLISTRYQLLHLLRFVRYWAKKSGMCDYEKSGRTGMTVFGFDILVVHFLIQKGLLPALHEMRKPEVTELCDYVAEDYEDDIESIRRKFGPETRNWNLAQLFNEFLEYYLRSMRTLCAQPCSSKKISRMDTKWNKKHFMIYDPFRRENLGNNVSIPMQIYIMNNFLWTYCYMNIPNFLNRGSNDEASVELYVKVKESQIKLRSAKKKMKTPRGSDCSTPTTSTPKRLSQVQKIEKKESSVSCQKVLFPGKAGDTRYHTPEVLATEEERDGVIPRDSNNPFAHLRFDGLLMTQMKESDYQIDDHLNQQYGRKALLRFRRTNSIKISDTMIGVLKRNKICTRDLEFSAKQNLETPIKNKEKKEKTKKAFQMRPLRAALPNLESPLKSESPCVSDLDTSIKSEWPSLMGVAPEPIACYVNSLIVTDEPIESSTIEDANTVETDDVFESKNSQISIGDVLIPKEGSLIDIDMEITHTAEIDDVLENKTPLISTEDGLIQKETNEKIAYEQFHANMRLDPINGPSRGCLFDFETVENFNGGYQPDRRCTFCESHDHERDNCPELKLPEYKPITRTIEQDELLFISEWMENEYESSVITDEDINKVEELVDHLKTTFQFIFKREVRLTVFGSYRNQLGIRDSDVDICFRFKPDDKPDDPELSAERVISTIDRKMRMMDKFSRVDSIINAKVPIVKFMTDKFGRQTEGDISYYNSLAIYNTELLKTYCSWWPPLKKLGIFIKKWAKHSEIGDASKGSLSSYAYTLLLIHYLQRCEPPVLPILQDEPFVTEDDIVKVVDGHNVRFCRDVGMREKMGWQTNTQSLAEHFLGFLNYYCQFEFDAMVVQIRRKRPLSVIEKQRESARFEKTQQWLHKKIYIEDPFDLTHNLPVGISEKMFVYIIRAFHAARRGFMDGEAIQEWRAKSNGTGDEADKLLGKNVYIQHSKLSEKPPMVCKSCHKLGHFADSCQNKPRASSTRGGYSGRNRGRRPKNYSNSFSTNGVQFSTSSRQISHGFVRSSPIPVNVDSSERRPQQMRNNRDRVYMPSNQRRGGHRDQPLDLITGDDGIWHADVIMYDSF